MKTINFTMTVYQENWIPEIKKILKKDIALICENDDGTIRAIIFGDSTYNFEIADFLSNQTPEELEKLKKLAKINTLKKQLELLESEI